MPLPKGFRHSPETKERLAVAMRQIRAEESPEQRERRRITRPCSLEKRAKIAASHMGLKHTDEARAKMSVAKTGKSHHTLEWRQKMSALFRGRPAPFPNRRFYYNAIAFRSSWEVRVARALDAAGIRWMYESKRFDLGTQTYAPDFYLPDLGIYWEVKGYFGPKSQRTIALFRDRYPDVSLVIINRAAMIALERIVGIAA